MRLLRTTRASWTRSPGPRSAPRRAFTLLEVLLALTLMILMLAGIVGFYHTTIKAREAAVNSIREVLLMRSLLEQIANEIRHATDIVPGDGRGFSGREDRLTLVRLVTPDPGVFNIEDPTAPDLPPAQADLLRVSYELLWDEELRDDEGVKICHGLWRTQQRTFDPNPRFVIAEEDAAEMGGDEFMQQAQESQPMPEGELFAPEIKYLKFEYFDGAEWRDRWDQEGEADEGSADLSAEGEGAGAGTGLNDPGGGEQDAGESGGESLGTARGQDPAQSRISILPQAIKITVGKIREPPPEDELDITQLKETEERLEDEVYHPDRYSIVIYLRQADQSRLSSRKHGVDNDLQMGGQTEGQ